MKLEYIGSTQYLTPRGILRPGAIIEVNSNDRDASFFLDAMNNLKLFRPQVSELPERSKDSLTATVADEVSIEVKNESSSQSIEVKVEKQDSRSKKRKK